MISENIAQIRRRMAKACQRAGRNPGDVTLVAVSKTFPGEVVAGVRESGIADLGENYVQEMVQKRALLTDPAIRWHFIGHLQSNKARQIVEWITLIHSVESVSLAKELDRHASRIGKPIRVLVEVNTTGSGSQYGISPDKTVEFVRTLNSFTGIHVAGLMTIGPFLPDPEMSRPMFRTLRGLSDELSGLGQNNVSMEHLSMGMTGDFEVAIEEGATLVRLGTAIFGKRTKPA